MEERLETVSNEQLWAVVEMIRTIVEMSPDIPTALTKIDGVITNVRPAAFGRKTKDTKEPG